jgi:hypothetical protein
LTGPGYDGGGGSGEAGEEIIVTGKPCEGILLDNGMCILSVNADPLPLGPSWGEIILARLLTRTLDAIKSAYCSIPSVGFGVSARAYNGLGGGPVVDVGFDPASGHLTATAGIDVGIGYGVSTEWKWDQSGTSGRSALNGWEGSVGGNVNVRLGPAEGGASQTLIDSNGAGFGGVSAGARPNATGLTLNANIGPRGGYGGQVRPSC